MELPYKLNCFNFMGNKLRGLHQRVGEKLIIEYFEYEIEKKKFTTKINGSDFKCECENILNKVSKYSFLYCLKVCLVCLFDYTCF